MITMFDSVDTPLLPLGAGFAYAAYIDGKFANASQIRARFFAANILTIAVFARDDADCLDVETGDATPAQAAGWVTRQLSRGVKRPCLYASASVMPQILSVMKTAGVSRNLLRLWSAHYTHKSHICGPATCREMSISADGTQFTDRARGINLDQSLLLDDFFGEALTSLEAIVNNFPVLKLPSAGQPFMSDGDFPHWYIRRLQLILNGIYGLYKGSIDGIYGTATAAAVKALQGQLKLAQDSTCGPVTWVRVIGGL